MSEKTEKPSPRKLREARRQGQLPRSRMLSGTVVSAGALLGLMASAPHSGARLLAVSRRTLSGEVGVERALSEALSLLCWVSLPPVAAALVASAGVSVAFAGFQAHPELLAPKLERLSLVAGLKRLFTVRQLVDLSKAFLAIGLIAWVMGAYVVEHGGPVLRAVRLEGAAGMGLVLAVLPGLMGRGLAVLLVLGGADYLLARSRHLKDLRMSREDLKREHKESEGDPHHKGKRKQLHRALAQGGAARGVQKATAIVVNPTHIAVALRYSPEECDAPYLVAKGREEDALKIRREAKRLGIPVVRDIPLARSLVHFDVGEEVPEELYQAAAAVLKVALEESSVDVGPGRRTP